MQVIKHLCPHTVSHSPCNGEASSKTEAAMQMEQPLETNIQQRQTRTSDTSRDNLRRARWPSVSLECRDVHKTVCKCRDKPVKSAAAL